MGNSNNNFIDFMEIRDGKIYDGKTGKVLGRKVDDEEHERYVNFVQRQRDLGKVKYSKSKVKKKGISKKALATTILGVTLLAGSGYVQFQGANKIVQDIESSGCVKEKFFVRDDSVRGCIVDVIDAMGNHYTPDTTQYIDGVYMNLIENGFSYDQAAIYLGAMGIDESTLEGTSLIGRTGARLSAYADLIRENDVEKGVGRNG